MTVVLNVKFFFDQEKQLYKHLTYLLWEKNELQNFIFAGER